MKIHYSLTLSFLFFAGATLGSKATIVANSDFDTGYTTGSLAGQSGTDDVGLAGTYAASSNTDETATVVSGGLTYSAGNVLISGGTNSVDITQTIPGETGNINIPTSRAFDSTLTGETLYERIVIDNSLAPSTNTGTFLDFELNENTNATGALEGLKNGALGAEGPSGSLTSSTGIALASGNNLLIAEYVWNPATSSYSTVNFFLNPTSTTQGTPTATVTTSGASLGSTFGILTGNLGNGTSTVTYGIDSFAIGTTYADVVTAVPEPSTIALLLTGGLALMVIARRNRAIA